MKISRAAAGVLVAFALAAPAWAGAARQEDEAVNYQQATLMVLKFTQDMGYPYPNYGHVDAVANCIKERMGSQTPTTQQTASRAAFTAAWINFQLLVESKASGTDAQASVQAFCDQSRAAAQVSPSLGVSQ